MGVIKERIHGSKLEINQLCEQRIMKEDQQTACFEHAVAIFNSMPTVSATVTGNELTDAQKTMQTWEDEHTKLTDDIADLETQIEEREGMIDELREEVENLKNEIPASIGKRLQEA